MKEAKKSVNNASLNPLHNVPCCDQARKCHYAASGDCPDRNGNVGGDFCPSRLKSTKIAGKLLKQAVLLNAWKGKNPTPLGSNVPVRAFPGGSDVGGSGSFVF